MTVQSEAEHMSKKHLDDHNQPTQPAQQPKRQRNYNDSLTIFVSNLPFDATDADLHQLFAAVGPLRNVRLIRDQKQQSKGYAYIEYQTAEGVASALSLNQSTLRGRIINVARSCPPSNKPSERLALRVNLIEAHLSLSCIFVQVPTTYHKKARTSP